MRREIQLVRTIDIGYPEVRLGLRDRCWTVLDILGEPPRLRLSGRVGGTRLTREIAVTIDAFDDAGDECRVAFRNEAGARRRVSAHFVVTIDAVSLASRRTALFLRATYEPPLGPLGRALDGLGGHRLFTAALEELLERVSRRLAEPARYARPS